MDPQGWPGDTPLSAKAGTKFCRQMAVTQSVYSACGLKETEFVCLSRIKNSDKECRYIRSSRMRLALMSIPQLVYYSLVPLYYTWEERHTGAHQWGHFNCTAADAKVILKKFWEELFVCLSLMRHQQHSAWWVLAQQPGRCLVTIGIVHRQENYATNWLTVESGVFSVVQYLVIYIE
jgi:hypothetical protein